MTMFPLALNVLGVAVVLHADGTWSGDAHAFVEMLRKATPEQLGAQATQLWLIAASMTGGGFKRDAN